MSHVNTIRGARSCCPCILKYQISNFARVLTHLSLSERLLAKIVEVESCRIWDSMHKYHMAQYMELFPFDTNNVNQQSKTETTCQYSTYERVIKGSSVLQHCLDIWIKNYQNVSIPDCWGNSYQKYIQNYNQYEGISTFVISNENLALPPFGNIPTPEACGTIFNNMLESLGDNSEIDIVFTQRLHYDRMISMFGQEFDGEKFYTRPKLKKWPQDGGIKVPYLEKYINDFPVDRLAKSINCFRYASNKNPRITFKVIDFHIKKPGVVESFMDVVTRNATLTKLLADENRMIGAENLAMERDRRIQFDRIAIAAKKSGLLPALADRNEVRNAVSKYFQEKGLKLSDVKLMCPPLEFYDDLTNNTVLIHSLLFPQKPVEAIRGRLKMFDFKDFRDIYCEVDGHATLQEDVMRSFVEQYKT